MIPELVDIGLTDAQAVEAMQRAFRCMTRDETEAQIGAEAAARQNADDALTAAIAQLNTALLNYAKRQELAAEITARTAGFDAHEAAFRAVFAAGAKNLLNVQDAENYRAGQGRQSAFKGKELHHDTAHILGSQGGKAENNGYNRRKHPRMGGWQSCKRCQ